LAEIGELNLRFSSKTAEDFFNCGKRNICWVSGYGAGKTWAAWQKLLVLMYFYPGYRVCAARRSRTELTRTTKQTFYKVCPPSWIRRDVEGMTPETELFNGSKIYWMNVDEHSESALRSLEVNSVLVDQAEEMLESVYLTLDSRVGRWDMVEIPDGWKDQLPVNEFTGASIAPAYHIILVNPPDEGEFSWIYQRYDDATKPWASSHAFFESSSTDNTALNKETLSAMMSRDEEWIQRYVYGKRTQGAGAIHRISPLSILDVDEDWIRFNLIKKANLSRVLDHGSSSPTCCTWWASINGAHYGYREYYKPDAVISVHRKNIATLSGDEYYTMNVSDPSMFKEDMQKYGGFWTVAKEYADSNVYCDTPDDAPPIYWNPADNNEFATRNRINELLAVTAGNIHPITKESPAPGLYFCRKSEANPHGMDFTIAQTASQKKKLLDTINGKPVYCDDRDDKVTDHAYDTVRYKISQHIGMPKVEIQKPKHNSFRSIQNRIKALRKLGVIG
jgi:hypothetical protein